MPILAANRLASVQIGASVRALAIPAYRACKHALPGA
jgi:hypothetical protein